MTKWRNRRICAELLLWELQNTTRCEQPSTGQCWIPPKKITHVQGQRRSPSKMVGGAKSCLESNPIPARDTQRAQTKPCVTKRSHKDWPDLPLSVWASPVEVQVRSCLPQGQGLWLQQTWVWHKPSCRMSSFTPPQRHWADDPQTAEKLYQRNSHAVRKVLEPKTEFPTWGSGKGTEKSQGISLWRPVGFDYRTSTGLGKQTLGGHKENLVHTRTQEKTTVSPKRDWPRLACECPGVSSGGVGR